MEKFTWQDKRWLKYISRDNWQSGSELQEQIDALEMIELMFEYKEISKETIAKKKKELQQAQAAMRRYAAHRAGTEKSLTKSGWGGSKGEKQQAKIKRAQERKKRGLKGRTGIATHGTVEKVPSEKHIGRPPVAKDREMKGLEPKQYPTKSAQLKTKKKATAYYRKRKAAGKEAELKNMGKEGVKKKEAHKRKLAKKKRQEWVDDIEKRADRYYSKKNESVIEKYLCKDKKKKKEINESSELWFGSWNRPHMIWVRNNQVLFSNNAEFPTGSPMGESERKAAQSRGYILVDW